MPQNPLHVRIANQLSELPKLHRSVEEFANAFRITDEVVFSVNLVFDELLTNTISYGYRDSEPHYIDVILEAGPSSLQILIADDGMRFNPLKIPDPDITSPLEHREVGGLGVHLVRSVMDDLSYVYEDGKNKLTLIKQY